MRLYLNENPRTFFITENNYALVLRHPFPQYKNTNSNSNVQRADKSTSKQSSGSNPQQNVIVEFISCDLLELSKYRDITPHARQNKPLLGFLGLLSLQENIYLGFITGDYRVASPKLGENIKVISNVNFYCLNNDKYDSLINKQSEEDIATAMDSSLHHHLYHHHHHHHHHHHIHQLPQSRDFKQIPGDSVRKLLTSGAFFYSRDFDICSSVQERGFSSNSEYLLVADLPYQKQFLWNSYMSSQLIDFRNTLSPLERQTFDRCGFLVTITRGYAKTINTMVDNEEALLTLITKQSCLKNGPLFGNWGCDDTGAVSNFAESEVIIYTEKKCFSYVTIRGNVPIYWHLENHSKLLSGRKGSIIFPRSFEASQYAFARHFDRLVFQYGDVYIINSLSQDSKSYKGELNQKFNEHISYFNRKKGESTDHTDGPGTMMSYQLPSRNIPIAMSTIRRLGYSSTQPHEVIPALVDSVINYSATFYDYDHTVFTGRQLGVFRINSFDSLGKANYLSKVITQLVIELAFRDVGAHLDHDLFNKHAKLWEENEECLSYLTINFQSNSSKLHDAGSSNKGLAHYIPKKYLSGGDSKLNEVAMFKLLGRIQDQMTLTFYNPMHSYVQSELEKKAKDFTSNQEILIYSSTFNVNGSCYHGSIKNWLFPHEAESHEYDLVFIGIQEIVELNASQMVNVDATNRIFWERKIEGTLNNHGNRKYVSLWSGQLGGIALLLYVDDSKLGSVSNVEGSFKKTGLGGMSANKGGVAVRLNYYDTNICFVSSHLAAGLNNVDERHQNYKTLAKGLKFSKNRRIRDHDAVIWLGDFNFRIDLTYDTVKPMIEKHEFSKLFEFDQLNKQMANGETFPFFDEKEIQFRPTYKFDNGTSDYDTSEKQRVPAWTDRILSLSRNKLLKQLSYHSAPSLTFSDHRPVYGLFTCSVSFINEPIKEKILQTLYENYRKKYGGDMFFTKQNLSFMANDEKSLPPPSSEIAKWWLEGGKAARVDISKLNSNNDTNEYIINPHSPVNPFEPTDEPEFLTETELVKRFNSQDL